TNGPLLVRTDTGRLLTRADVHGESDTAGYIAWSAGRGRAVRYDPAAGAYEADSAELSLFGARSIDTAHGPVVCRPAFDLAASLCAQCTPDRVETICGIPANEVERAAQLLWEERPVAYYAWSGVEMQSNATQIARAIAQLYALTGSFDAPGGNVLFAAVPSAPVAGQDLLAPEQRARTLGAAARHLGPGGM